MDHASRNAMPCNGFSFPELAAAGRDLEQEAIASSWLAVCMQHCSIYSNKRTLIYAQHVRSTKENEERIDDCVDMLHA